MKRHLFFRFLFVRSSIITSAISLLITIPYKTLAEVVGVEITERIPLANGYSFPDHGAYERISGQFIIALDPNRPENQRVHDLKLAPKTKDGNVEFKTAFTLVQPVDPTKGNGRLIYDVHNRGNKLALWTFNSGTFTNDPKTLEDAGNGFLMRHGYSVLWTAWNAEVPKDEAAHLLSMEAPIASDKGKAIRGKIHLEICVAEKIFSRPFAWSQWGIPRIFPVYSLDNQHAKLTRRANRSEPATKIPHDEWAFAIKDEKTGDLTPDSTSLYLKSGFEPGVLYDLTYEAEHPRVAGAGIVALRDIISFLKQTKGALTHRVEKAYLFGISQSGRLGNFFIHEGFNADLSGQKVFDAALLHVPGSGKGHFSARFRNATDSGNHHEANWCGSEYFPFSPTPQKDPVTGQEGSVLDKARHANVVPKIFYVQSSTEYWARAASLLHTDVEGKVDLELPEEVRIYMTASSQHLGAGDGTPGEGQQPRNILDDRGPVLRALLIALDRWETSDIAPPPSQYPKIADGTLINLEAFRASFPKIPQVNLPQGYYQPVRLDFGPRLESEGIADIIPPQVGKPWQTLVPAVNPDGNEVAGIVLPEIAVPLATYTGWNLRNPQFGPPEMLTRFDGMHVPFAKNAEERAKTSDPRPSIKERYPSREVYLSKITEAALKLQAQNLLLDEDVVRILERATKVKID